jgi:protein phosphatase PTC1
LLDAENTGSTACVCIVRQEFGHKFLYVANVGDTRAVLSKNGVAERMSQDHKATDKSEVERIKSGGGIVLENRVGGTLAITRAFGDHSLKREGVTAKPFINKHAIRPFDKFLVIASDGVWDVLEDQDAINFCKDEFNTKDIAQAIVKSALDKGSKDNISCLVLKFASSPF